MIAIFFLHIAILDVNLTSTPVCVNSSSNVSLTCTATLPLPHELEFAKVFNWTKEFKWTKNGSNITTSASDPTDPMGIISVSTLNTAMTTPGVFVFKCEVSIIVMGDPVETKSSSSTVIVPGMKRLINACSHIKKNLSFAIVYDQAISTKKWQCLIISY